MRVIPVLLALAACGERPVDCTMEARASVVVTVVDEGGQPIPDATVTYSVDGGASAPCESPSGDDVFVCGYEEEGSFAIHVESPGAGSVDLTAEVGSDECHVVTEQLTAELPGLDCTMNEVESIRVTVTGSAGEALEGVAVTYAPSGGDDSAPCSEFADHWTCGTEEAGDFVVTGTANGHTTAVANVTVEADACHVITENVDLVVEWLPD